MIPKEARPTPHKPLWYQQSSPFAACCWEECTRISPSSSLGTAHLSQPGGLTHPLEFDLRGALVLPPHACVSSPQLYPQDDSTHSVISLCPLVAVSSPTHICGHSFLLIRDCSPALTMTSGCFQLWMGNVHPQKSHPLTMAGILCSLCGCSLSFHPPLTASSHLLLTLCPPTLPVLQHSQLPSPDLSWRWTVHTLLLAHQAWFFFFLFFFFESP